MKDILVELYNRDILKLKDEISKYKNENVIWETSAAISNSGGNLCLHLVGNLNHFIGTDLGKTGYKRDRDKEFSQKDIPADVLIDMLEKTRELVVKTLSALPDNDLMLDFPEKYNDKIQTTGFMLLHLLAHLNYHVGQVNYHRRLLDK